MSSSNRRVVLTGVGVITPLGLNAATFWESLHQGRSGIRQIQSFATDALPTRIAGEILDFEPKKFILTKEGRKSMRVMARSILLAVAAAQNALDHGQVDLSKIDPTRFGIEFGSSLIASELLELAPASLVSRSTTPGRVDLHAWGTEGLANISPLWMLKYLPNMLGCHVSILHNAQGPNNTITESDVAGLLALCEASRIIRRNQADFFLVGGAESKINPLSMVRSSLFSKLSTRNDQPEKAMRPFDAARDGPVVGEGGGVVVAEDLEHAHRRGATIYAEVLGCGSAFDRGMTGSGVARAIRAALGQAKLTPEEIDHVNAQGLSSVKLDAGEAKGIHEVFGQRKEPVPVWAVKSYLGNLGAGSGITELSASVLAMQHGTLPPTLNFEKPDPACPVAVQSKPRPISKPNFLKIGFTEMGQVAAIVCRKWGA